MSKEHLLHLLSQNEIDKLFPLLRENATSELVLLESQWNDLKADLRAGVLTQEHANIEEARIRQRLLDFIEKGDRPSRGHAPQAGRSTNRWLLLGAGLAVGLLLGFLLLKPLFSENTETTTDPVTNPGSAAETAKPADPFSKKIAISTALIELSADYVGTTGFQFVEATLGDKTPQHYRLSVRMRCIRPPYGENISSHTLHLVHGPDEIAPYEVDFPFVNAKTTGEGVLRFEVPKTWDAAELVLYYGTGYEKKANVPIRF
ncbi:MAG: hypothetical protein ACKVU2_15785 [Saprospiraceae bacterium]